MTQMDQVNNEVINSLADKLGRLTRQNAQLVEALESAQAVIRKLASEGRYFDNLDRTMGLEGFINHALASAKGAS